MSKSVIVTLSVVAVIVFGIIFMIGGAISWSNHEVDLAIQTNAQGKVVGAKFDNMWKTIAQLGQVETKYRESFVEMVTDIAAARKTQGEMMRWIQESNPTLTPQATTNLMTAIEAQRMTFTTEQQKWVDFAAEHNKLIQKFPGVIYNIIFSRALIDPKLILSSRTEEAVKTGRDDDVNVYDKK